MAILKYTDVGIHSVSACVPQKVVRNSELDNLIPKADLEKTIHSIGIRERRIAERAVPPIFAARPRSGCSRSMALTGTLSVL